MDAARVIAECFAVIAKGGSVADLIARNEISAGFRVVRPGEVAWLPIGDWEPGTCCSVTESGIARLVLLHARESGKGAFARLLVGIDDAGLIPHVIEPTREFAAALKRNGWRERLVNTKDGRERVWKRHPLRND